MGKREGECCVMSVYDNFEFWFFFFFFSFFSFFYIVMATIAITNRCTLTPPLHSSFFTYRMPPLALRLSLTTFMVSMYLSMQLLMHSFSRPERPEPLVEVHFL
jgi:hypothetical protein